jgi:UDP-2,3-diacylglucosamine hydrolase
MDVNHDAVAAAFRAAKARRMIHGHTHRPGVHNSRVDDQPAQRIVLGAWYEQGSYLEYERGEFELKTLTR